jgi:hypothetical protein
MATTDAYTAKYTLWCVAIAALLWGAEDLDRIFNLYIFLVPVLALPTLFVGAGLTIGLVVNVLGRRWRRVMSILVAPILAGSFFISWSIWA